MQRIVIVGAGIGGLCTARAVALAGLEPVVLERSPAGGAAIGAGLTAVAQRGAGLGCVGVRSGGAHGRRSRSAHRDAQRRRAHAGGGRSRGSRAPRGAPMLVVERPALQAVLADGLAVRCDVAVSTADERGVTLLGGERVEGDAVIGADGIGSVVREHVYPGAWSLDTGYTVIRGIADHDIGRGEAFEAWGRGELVGGVALPARRSYWFYEAPSALLDGQDLLAAVGAERWPAPVPAQLAATAPETVLVNRILRLRGLPTWTRGTVALLGDAAHAMEPNLGQGAAQAIEDAEALLIALRAGGELSGVLRAYSTARRRRARMLQYVSSRFARLALSTHTGPRDLMMRVSPEPVRRCAIERLLRHHTPRRPSPAG